MLSRSAIKPRHKNAPRPAEKSARGFLQYVRGRRCLVAVVKDHDRECEGKIEAAHVDYAGGKGMGSKVADRHAVALCSKHHRLQHNIGWLAFERKCLDARGRALAAAEQLWRFWPGRARWEKRNAS